MKPLRVALGILELRGRCFLQRRALDSPILPGLWEFPGGKLEPGESPLEALLRELREEIACVPENPVPLPVFHHAYADLEVECHPFLCRTLGREGLRPRNSLAWAWFTAGEARALPVPEANSHFIEGLHEIL